MLKEVEKTVSYYAFITARKTRNLDIDDVRQSLYVKALTIRKRFDRKKAGVNTFISKVVENASIDLQRDAIKMTENVFYTDFSNFDIAYNPMREVHVKLYLDDVARALSTIPGEKAKNALKIFTLMRKGYTQADCSDELNLSPGYVCRLFREYIQPIGKKALS